MAATKLAQAELGSMTRVRTAVAANDSATPEAAAAVLDCSDVRFIVVDCVVTGTTPSFTVTPLFWNAAGEQYVRGDAYTITANSRFALTADGCADVYFMVTGITGTGTPTITIEAGRSCL